MRRAPPERPYDPPIPSPAPDKLRFDGFAIDLDGVVWLSHQPIPGSIEALRALGSGETPVVFITNDPRSTRAEHAARLTDLGAPTTTGQVLTSGAATARVVAAEHPGAAVLSIGTDSLAREIADCGLRPVTTAEADADGAPELEAVIVGGGAGFDYETLRISANAARGGAALWATNIDATYPSSRGLTPGTGAIVAAIEYASGVEATNVGKPEPLMFEQALEILGLDDRPGTALMAGDTLGSDIDGGARAGMATAFILSGKDDREHIGDYESEPDYVFEDLAALAAAL